MLGSAAVVIDRTRENREDPSDRLIPEQFAQMNRVANNNDVTILKTPLTERQDLQSTTVRSCLIPIVFIFRRRRLIIISPKKTTIGFS